MPVPDFQSLMLPTLAALSGSSDTSVAEVRQRVAAAEGLTPEEVQELLPSGRQPVFTNRVSWAIIHMERSGLVEKVQRGIYRLAAAGEQLLAQSPTRIDVQFLRHYPAYVAWRKAPSQKQDSAPTRVGRCGGDAGGSIGPCRRAITSLLSRPHSTADRGRLSVGNPHPKPSTNCYSHTSEDVLRRPLEPGLCVSRTRGGGSPDRDGLWRGRHRARPGDGAGG